MPSPSKKRKLDNNSKAPAPPSRGLEYFFSKQRQNAEATSSTSLHSAPAVEASGQLTDEELARKLQAEWDQEIRNNRNQTTVQLEPIRVSEPSFSEALDLSQDVNQISSPPLSAPAEDTPAPVKQVNTLSLQSVAAAEDTISESIPLDESPLTFVPSQYVAQLQAQWATDGGVASYALLTRCFVLVSSTQSRIKIVDTLVNCLRLLIESDPSSLLPAVSPIHRPVVDCLSNDHHRFGLQQMQYHHHTFP
jgi:DNA ligase 1